MASNQIRVEVAYARPDQQKIIQLSVLPGTTAAQAIVQSGITEHFPEIDLARNKIGIFGKLAKPDTILRDCDRVEIYRPLVGDPKDVRRKRAEDGKGMRKKEGKT